MIRFDDHSKLKSTEGFGIDGTLVDLTLVKSRTNKAGQFATLVFNQDTGFDEELSLLYLLKDNNRINGAGAYLYIGNRSDLKFSQKAFKDKLEESAEFMEVFMNEVMDVLSTMINDIGYVETDSNAGNLSSSILGRLNSFAA